MTKKTKTENLESQLAEAESQEELQNKSDEIKPEAFGFVAGELLRSAPLESFCLVPVYKRLEEKPNPLFTDLISLLTKANQPVITLKADFWKNTKEKDELVVLLVPVGDLVDEEYQAVMKLQKKALREITVNIKR